MAEPLERDASQIEVLVRVLWSQVVRVLHDPVPAWAPDSPAARVIRRTLLWPRLKAGEARLFAGWEPQGRSSRRLFDRLLERRVDRALRLGLVAEGRALGRTSLPEAPRVAIVRGDQTPPPGTGSPVRGAPTVVEILSQSLDVVDQGPGAGIDQLLDALILADRPAFEELQLTGTLDVHASFHVAADGVEHGLLSGQSRPVRVLEIERALARVEQVLRAAIPAEQRPAAPEWSFGRDLTGQLLGGKYRVKALKGVGGFKSVYEAVDEQLGARVALAVLKPRGARSQEAIDAFRREARQLTSLDHENIVRWITFDRTGDGLHYFVMEYLAGAELEKILNEEGPLPPRRAAEILLQVLAALRRAHRLEGGALLHLDLKPENVFVLPPRHPGEAERVKVIDFGIGQHVGAEVRAAERAEQRSARDIAPSELGRSFATQGALLVVTPGGECVQRARGGTLLYASPEQTRHLFEYPDIVALDERSDLYSLGVMAFRMLTGEFPWERCDTAERVKDNHLHQAPRSVRALGVRVPRRLAHFVDRCLAKDRDARWRDAAEAHAYLQEFVRPRVASWKVAAPVTVAGAALGSVLWWNRPARVEPLDVIDPGSGAPVEALVLGPDRPTGTLAVPVVDAERVPSLVDVGTGRPAAGWSVAWDAADAPGSRLVVSAERKDGTRATVRLRLDGSSRERWLSDPFDLVRLGPWTLELPIVEGLDGGTNGTRRLDPEGRSLTVVATGDPVGRAELIALELWAGEELVAERLEPERSDADGRTLYSGLALDGLGRLETAPGPTRLRLHAEDGAGGTRDRTFDLDLAGPPVDWDQATGFVEGSQARTGDAAGPRALPDSGGKVVLVEDNALRLVTTGAARVGLRIVLDDDSEMDGRTILLEQEPFAVLLALEDLGFADAELRGEIRLEADDAPWVDRATPHLAERALPFVYLPDVPHLTVELRSLDGEVRTALEPGAELTHTRLSGAANLEVRPGDKWNLWLEARIRAPGIDEAPVLRKTSATGALVELPIELPEVERCEIALQPFLVLEGGEQGGPLGHEQTFPLRIDTLAPVVRIRPEGVRGAWIGPGDAPRLLVEVEESGELLSSNWTLVEPGGSRRTEVLEGMPGALDLWPLLWPGRGAPADGPYLLELEARDRAGNVEREEHAFEVALEGPHLDDPEEPTRQPDGRHWFLPRPEALNVRVRISDPNGVAGARARFTLDGTELPEADLIEVSDGLYELPLPARPPLHGRWADRELVIEVVATDRAGRASAPWRGSARVPELPSRVERRVAPRGRPDERMVLVEGNEDFEFVFGGRDGQDRAREWNVGIPEGRLASFYLDEREVSRGEFLAFVLDPEGYRDARHWPAGATVDEARRRALAGSLVDDETHPVTGVSLPEALAYAHWRRKRLPTLLEWEYAVRGGKRYAETAGSEHGLRGLCEAPLEWSATPRRLAAGGLDFPAQCRTNLAGLLAPLQGETWDDGAWVVGGGEETWHDSSLRPSDARRRHADVGFRCALAADEIHGLLDRGEYVLAAPDPLPATPPERSGEK